MSDLSPVPNVPMETPPAIQMEDPVTVTTTTAAAAVAASTAVAPPPMNGTPSTSVVDTQLLQPPPPHTENGNPVVEIPPVVAAPVVDSVVDPSAALPQQQQHQHQQPGVQVILPLEEFADDLDLRLGRANGNIYQRRPGIDGVHDGQVMVRLKKKRFIVIDYGIAPNEHDLQAAAMHPNISVPLGAGVAKCTGKIASEPGGPLVPCKKIGVPVLLYDSEPDQPPSLYLRSGLCFVCQRNLNEKRRTQRKRPSERANQAQKITAATAQHSQAAFLAAHPVPLGVVPTSVTSNLPGMQTVRIGGIGTQANLVGAGTTGRVNATPHHRVLMAVTNGHKKIKLAHTNQPLVLAPDAIILNGPPDNHSCKSVRTGHGFAEIGTDLSLEVHQSLQSTQTLLHSVNTPEMIQQGIPPPTPDEISRTYDQAFYSLSKSLYLLVQWKTSWDAAIASAIQQEAHVGVGPPPNSMLGGLAPDPQHQQQHPQQHPQQQQQQQQQPQAVMQPMAHQNAVALQAANAAATAAIGGMINGVPGSVPVGIPSIIAATEPTNLAQAVASAAAVAAVSQQPPAKKQKNEATSSPALDQSVEV
eukprot:CAMPEP_0116154634 /NCGR_PEP_ID=MMETSP0329-20121206/21885_1 /TAXON_ID=697910 /ORGANISM="Pseudo-nitzschia arenysensis, Strain B593" /LENGTH=583 /DNA_ID=CAMNT_0003651627 /DNA_START=96 /DNA_END=1847 /DNA_ORIENTATION=-